jgi:2-methylcitrate dehydratase PrpD
MDITSALARFAVETRFADLPAAAVAHARRSILDYVGCALLGATRPGPRLLHEVIAAQGGVPAATVIGRSTRLPAPQAALLNGASGHVDDYDDAGGVGGHAAVTLTPAVFAVGEERDSPGAEVLAAWVVGYEVGEWLSRRLVLDRPFHGTGVFGTPAAAVAAGRLLGLDASGMAMAIGIAVSQSSGLERNFGTMTKAFHAGHAASGGVLAAQLAAAGFTASPDIVDGRQGFADCFGGEKCNLAHGAAPLGEWYALASAPPAIKAWPSCFGTHPTLSALRQLQARTAIAADDVTAIQITIDVEPATGPVYYTDATNWLEGKFCREFTLAAALVDGEITTATYTDERVHDPRIRRLMACTQTRRDPEVARRSARLRRRTPFAELAITLRDGSVLVERAEAIHTLDGAAVLDKYRENAAAVLPAAAAETAAAEIGRLETLASIAPLVRALAAPDAVNGSLARRALSQVTG